MVEAGVQIGCIEDARRRGWEQAERIRQGDPAAFKELFLAHYEPLCRFAHPYVGSLEAAEDLVQEVFFDIWKRRADWHPKHSARAFLYGAVRHQILNHQRRARSQACRQDDVSELLSPDDPEEALQYAELARTAERAISDLPPRCQHVFTLSREHDLSYAEIATALGTSIKTVETHMGRALRHLRDRLSSVRL